MISRRDLHSSWPGPPGRRSQPDESLSPLDLAPYRPLRALAWLLILWLAQAPGWAAPPASQAVPLATETVPVSHPRELRGVWVASVGNMHFPSKPGLSTAEMKAELEALVDRVAECRLNTIFFQVRPEGDALYASQLEPWSRFLTGTQGGDPGFDPLAYLIEKAHPRGLEVHAWLNPYRATAAPAGQVRLVAPHLGAVSPDKVVAYGSYVWMEPTSPEVRQRLVDVCRDLVHRYDLDGLHFDDYFYPYPENGQEFPDAASWAAYQAGGGPLSKDDWRRDNVNQAVSAVAKAVHEEKSHVRFGISPFGLPAPERPPGIQGFDQRAKLYADPQLWSDHGYVDYLAPQLYWPTTRKEQAFQPLIEWWTDHAQQGRYTLAGLNLNGLETKPEWTLDEYRQEMALIRGRAEQGARGCIWWSVQPLLQDRGGVVALFQELYPGPALPPPMVRFKERAVAPPRVFQDGPELRLQSRDKSPLRAWAVYQERNGQWPLLETCPPDQAQLKLPAGNYAISAVTRYGTESQGQLVRVRD